MKLKSPMFMVCYGLLMLAGGGYAFSQAPDPSRALTAVIITGTVCGVMLVLAIMSAMINRSRILGMIGIHVGIVVPLLVGAVLTRQSFAVVASVDRYRAASAEFEKLRAAGTLPEGTDSAESFIRMRNDEAFRAALAAGTASDADPAARRSWERANAIPDHDRSYLRNTLMALSVLSFVAFIAILLTRPKADQRGASPAGNAS